MFKKGNIPWNKGKRKEDNEVLRNVGINHSKILKEKFKDENYKKDFLEKNKGCFKKGRVFSEEQEIKRIEALRKKGIWNKGLTKETDERVMNISKNLTGKKHTEKTLIKLSKIRKKMIKEGVPCGLFEKGHKINLGRKHSDKSKKNYRLSRLGNKNPAWRGGIAFEPYDKSFNNKFKRAIRKRDNYICLKCKIHQERLKRALDIHHIDYNKLLTIPQNCISLCNRCNSEVNKNRKSWTKFFQSLLSEKYNYQYLENKIILNINQGGG